MKYAEEFRDPKAARALLARIDAFARRASSSPAEPEIIELEINPLICNDLDVIAVDARIQVEYPPPQVPVYGHMAIHPYPQHLIERVPLPDGTDLTIRPISPEDAQMEQDFVRNLSDQTKYFRFMQTIKELTPEMLVRFTQIDYDREMALVAVVNEHTPRARILGVARYVSNPDRQSCEFALTVADEWQKKGIGRQLMQRLMTVARDRGIEIMEGEVLSNNSKMLRLCEKLGFRAVHSTEDPDVVEVRRHL